MSLRPPAPDSIALVTGAPSGIGEQVKAALAPNRKLPRFITLPMSKRMMARR